MRTITSAIGISDWYDWSMEPTTYNPELVSTAQAAELLDVTVPTVTRWVADNRLKPVFKGDGLRGAFVFTKSEIERFRAVRTAPVSE